MYTCQYKSIHMNDFFNRLKEERNKKGLTQEEFGLKCGVTKLTQSNYETGKRKPDIEYLDKAGILGCDIQYIITGEKNDLILVSNHAFGESALTIGFQRPWLERKGVNLERLILFTVKGDAMSPLLNTGDTLLVETYLHREITGNKVQIKQGLAPDEVLEHDGIYIVQLDGRQAVRQIQLMPSGARVFSSNSAFAELTIKTEEINNMVLGKVVWHAKDIG